MRLACGLCGLDYIQSKKRRTDHPHMWVTLPNECKCEASGWLGNRVTPICAAFEADGDTGQCAKCEHDAACHVTTNSPATA